MDQILEVLKDHWFDIVMGLAGIAFGWFVGNWRSRRRWEKKEFFDRVNVSLNEITEGTLRIRTVLEKSGQDIFLNSVAADAVAEAAEKTTLEDATLPLPKGEYWYYLNSVLNEIAEKFSTGVIRRDMGLGTKTTMYVICLTSECDDDIKTRKVRAMLIRKSLLENLPEDMPKLERDSHSVRWNTLQILARERTMNPWKFLEMEIVL